MFGTAPTPVQQPGLGLVESPYVHVGPAYQACPSPLDGIASFCCDNCTSQLGVYCKFAVIMLLQFFPCFFYSSPLYLKPVVLQGVF